MADTDKDIIPQPAEELEAETIFTPDVLVVMPQISIVKPDLIPGKGIAD